MEEPNAVGHAFNIANSRAITQGEALQALADAAAKKPVLVRVPRERIHHMGGHPVGPNLYFGVYFDLPPITQIVTKAQRVLTFKGTDFVTGLKETYRWYLRHHQRRDTDYAFEDRVMNFQQVQAAAH